MMIRISNDNFIKNIPLAPFANAQRAHAKGGISIASMKRISKSLFFLFTGYHKSLLVSAVIILYSINASAQMKLGLLVYNGGGDWYANPTSLKNLAVFCNEQLHTNFDPVEAHVEVGSTDIFNYPFLHMTGHGRWALNDAEAQNLRKYLEGGGFLHIDDNFGMDVYVRPALKKVFPELELVELPFSYPIYHQKYNFPNGLPKIHEHDGGIPKGWGLIYKGRLVCFYSFDTDLGDGWEDYDVHRDAPEKHQAALQMGANLIQYVFTNNPVTP